MDQQRALIFALAAKIEYGLHHAAIRYDQARHRFGDIVKRQPQMPLARKCAPVGVRMIRRQECQQVVAVKVCGDAVESTERADMDHGAITARRMGGAKRYPSIAACAGDGFREELNPSYGLA